jgi:ribonucleoside-diphosphate reductase alpha chain
LVMSAAEQVVVTNDNRAASGIGQTATAREMASNTSKPSDAVRRRLPDERRAITHHFSIGGQEGYLTVGVYEDGSPGEIFVRMAKEGSTVSGLMDGLATVVSLALQHGVPLRVLCAKLSHMRFEPSGWTGNPKIGFAKSILDYIARWLELRFLNNEQGELFGSPSKSADAVLSNPSHRPEVASLDEFVELGDSPACNICGGLMVRSGSCYRCTNCGSTSGCS